MSLFAVSHPFAKARRIAEQFRVVDMRNLKARADASPAEGPPADPCRARKVENKADPKASVGEIFLYDPIGYDCWTDSGVSAKQFAASLEAVKGVKTLNLYVNCEGGDVFEAKAMYSQLQRFGESCEVVAHIDGIAASAATFLVMAAKKIRTNAIATWMVHEAWSGAMGRAVDLRAMADMLEVQTETIAEIYAKRNGAKVADMLALMSAPPDGTWMTAAEALERGFTDEVVEPEQAAEPEGARNAVRNTTFNALELTQQRIKSVTTAELMRARANMNRLPPASREPAKPASR